MIKIPEKQFDADVTSVAMYIGTKDKMINMPIEVIELGTGDYDAEYNLFTVKVQKSFGPLSDHVKSINFVSYNGKKITGVLKVTDIEQRLYKKELNHAEYIFIGKTNKEKE